MSGDKQYEVNFFKPLSEHAKANKKLILILAAIWGFAVFGFQIALILLNEPTPENSYTVFESVWPAVVEDESPDVQKQKDFAKTLLYVLGKNIVVSDNHKTILRNTLSWTLFSMQADSMKYIFQKEPGKETYDYAAETIGLTSTGFDKIMIDLLPFSLKKVENEILRDENINAIPGIMKLYLVHNQNVLTDFKFLGFPFHYWYTAQFLLILFVVLCFVYAFVIEKTNTKHTFVEET